ncbi:STAS domain-containing protein [Catenulispora yoronensis]|uniref:Anti-sigma factor antagonist n=1 Tax=Catenulispora yoronensis TaxID=450799 RepID=A0ABN2U883_9ACTN
MTHELTTAVHTAPDGTVHLAVTGDLDFRTAPTLRAAVDQAPLLPGTTLVIDLTELEFCDSSGLTTLLAARRRAETAEARLALAGASAQLLRTFELTGLQELFTLLPASGS